MTPTPDQDRCERFDPPSEEFDGYIFDCDGTLADSMPLHFAAWRFALAEAGAPFEFTWELFTSRAGMSLELTVEALSEQFAHPMEAVAVAQNQRERFAALEPTLLPIAEVLVFARRVARSRPVAVASGSARPNVLRTLDKIGASDLFEVVVTPEDVEHGKPAPDMFLLAAQRMGVRPERCLVLEDAELGLEAARRAGMKTCLVRATPPQAERASHVARLGDD